MREPESGCPLRRELYRLLRSICFNCHRLRIDRKAADTHAHRLRRLLEGDLLGASNAAPGAEEGSDTDDGDGAFQVDGSSVTVGGLTSNVLAELQVSRVEGWGCRDASWRGEVAWRSASVGTELRPFASTPQVVMNAAFKSVNPSRCPHCECHQPKVKKVGKFKFMVEPLSAKHHAKNLAKNIHLRCAVDLAIVPSLISVDPSPCADCAACAGRCGTSAAWTWLRSAPWRSTRRRTATATATRWPPATTAAMTTPPRPSWTPRASASVRLRPRQASQQCRCSPRTSRSGGSST